MDFNFIVKFITVDQGWVIGIVGAIVGSIIAIISTIMWDNHKDKKRYKALLKTIIFELQENKKKIDDTITNLPEDLKTLFKSAKNSNVQVLDEQISRLAWTFPKPYSIDAWQAFISSGLVIRLSVDILQSLYRLYDDLHSINFLSNLSVNLFQILASDNRLDQETNKNFDRFCKIGTLTLVFAISGYIQDTIAKIKD
jgi:predicted PurR-regulated permease PerM